VRARNERRRIRTHKNKDAIDEEDTVGEKSGRRKRGSSKESEKERKKKRQSARGEGKLDDQLKKVKGPIPAPNPPLVQTKEDFLPLVSSQGGGSEKIRTAKRKSIKRQKSEACIWISRSI